MENKPEITDEEIVNQIKNSEFMKEWNNYRNYKQLNTDINKAVDAKEHFFNGAYTCMCLFIKYSNLKPEESMDMLNKLALDISPKTRL